MTKEQMADRLEQLLDVGIAALKNDGDEEAALLAMQEAMSVADQLHQTFERVAAVWPYDVPEHEVRTALRRTFANLEHHFDAIPLNDLAFWQREMKACGRPDIYDDEYRRHERAKRGIGI